MHLISFSGRVLFYFFIVSLESDGLPYSRINRPHVLRCYLACQITLVLNNEWVPIHSANFPHGKTHFLYSIFICEFQYLFNFSFCSVRMRELHWRA